MISALGRRKEKRGEQSYKSYRRPAWATRTPSQKEEEEGEKEIGLQEFWDLVLQKNHIIVGSQKMEKSQDKHVNIASGPKLRA